MPALKPPRCTTSARGRLGPRPAAKPGAVAPAICDSRHSYPAGKAADQATGRSGNNDLVTLRFRLAESRDVGGIVGLVDSAYRGDASREGWTTEADLLDGQRTDTEAVSAVIDARGSAMLVAEADGQLAGCYQLE